MEARSAGNAGAGGGSADELCRECALPACRETVPAVAELCRGMAECFIFVPAHPGVVLTSANIVDGRIVRPADATRPPKEA